MKKLLMLTALTMVAGAGTALAQGPGNGSMDGKGPRHKNPERMIEMIFKRHDTNEDGKISKDEFMKEAEERFAKMDADSDDQITREEAKAHAEKMKEQYQKRMEERGDQPPPPPSEK